MSDLAYAGIAELAPRIAAGEVSPVDLAEAVLARIERHNPHLNAYITVTADDARRSAGQAEQAIRSGNYLGPLHGIPVAVKDLFATRGVLSTGGSKVFADWVPDFDATAVVRLKEAGAVILGKTNLHELAYGTTSANAHYGPVQNPWKRDYHPGGSSGGSAAAVAAGLALGALGTDTGSSIRQPAACCGGVGLKPTYGLVSKHGVLPLCWSMDHVGPMTRTVRDAALMLQVLAGFDPSDPCSADRPVPDYMAALDGVVHGARIGVARAYFFDHCHPDVASAVEAAAAVLANLGAAIADIDLPHMEASHAAGSLLIAVEAAAYHAADVRARPQDFSDELIASLNVGGFYDGIQYVQAQRLRRGLTGEVDRALAPFDAVIMPTSPVPATPIARPGWGALRSRNTLPFNLLGLPALSVPCGFTAGGLPVGLQVVGKAFEEAAILRIAHAYEQATDWHTRRPSL